MKKSKKSLWVAGIFLIAFVLWTIAVSCIDVKEIGPNESLVGFATLNSYVHNLTGVNFALYNITDWLGLVPIAVCVVFGIIGLLEWIKHKKILAVDFDILILGLFYIVTIGIYVLFEYIVINYRPVLINGFLEVSYPSSTTMLVMCVMPTAIMQIHWKIKSQALKLCLNIAICAFVVFMVIGRLISGVHWVTDIIGGMILSIGLVTLYYNACSRKI